MPPTPSLVDLPLAEVLDALAKRAADRRTRPATYAEKVALEASNVLSAVGDFVNKNDSARGALLGGGAGALAGAGSALLGPGSFKDKRRRLGGSLLTGGLAGATLGGGLGAARQFGRGLAPSAGPSGEGGRGGTFTDPDTGRPMAIDPKVLKARPELASEVQRLSTPGVEQRVSQAVGAGAGAAAQYAPATSLMGLGILGKETSNAFRGTARYTRENLLEGLQQKDLVGRLAGKGNVVRDLSSVLPTDQANLVNRAKGPGGLRNMFRGADPNEVLHAHGGQQITRGDMRDILRAGHRASRVASGKLPVVTGRNAALMGGAGLVDLGRHMYLGQRDEDEQRKQLRELMGQVARETANRGR